MDVLGNKLLPVQAQGSELTPQNSCEKKKMDIMVCTVIPALRVEMVQWLASLTYSYVSSRPVRGSAPQNQALV